MQAIADQSKPVTVVVRVEDGTGDDEETKLAQTVSNIIGTTDENGQYTGLKALLAAESVTGVKPRILGVRDWIPKRWLLHWHQSVRSCALSGISAHGAVKPFPR